MPTTTKEGAGNGDGREERGEMEGQSTFDSLQIGQREMEHACRLLQVRLYMCDRLRRFQKLLMKQHRA